MAAATYKVEIDFETSSGSAAVYQAAGGTFTKYASSAGLVTPQNAYAASSTNTFGGAYDDVTRDVIAMNIKRGRDASGGPFLPGIIEPQLQRVASPNDAPSAPGGKELYNPASTTSPLSSYFVPTASRVDPGIAPMRPIRVTMTNAGTSRVIFYGFLTAWRYSRESGEATIEARDVLWKTSRTRPSFTQAAGATTASTIGTILDACGWSAPVDRDLNPTIQGVQAGTGDLLPASGMSPDGVEQSGLDLIDQLLATNRGYVYQRGSVITFENRQARSLRKAADYTLTSVALDYQPGFTVE